MTTWAGDKMNGVEFRWCDDGRTLDEVCLYVNGACVMHMEAMSEQIYWFGLYPPGVEDHVSFDVGSTKGRAHVEATSTDFTPQEPAHAQ